MNASSQSVNALLDIRVQYQVPLYQRRYVWDKSSWEELWKDIIDQEKLKSSKNAKHFTGPIVTRRIKGQQNRFEVIDGQQRLMTFQIIFCIIRDLCEPLKCCSLKSNAIDHLKNSENTIKDFKSRNPEGTLPPPENKFIPSEYDDSAFDKIVNDEYGDEINEVYDKNRKCLDEDKIEEVRSKLFGEETVSKNVLDAYNYFYKKIRKRVEEGTEEDTYNKINNLLEVIKSNFELVQITPGDSQKAEEIFESVNATGRQLSEFDYLRNNLFLRAGDESDILYGTYWPFEEDPDGYDWDDDRLESFFQAFLMAKWGPDIINKKTKLFDIYRRKLKLSAENVENEFKDIRDFAETYKKLDLDPKFKGRMQFYQDLSTYENKESYDSNFTSRYKYNITLVRSFIMYLQHGLDTLPNEDEILKALEILESYVMRRILVDNVTGNYAYQAIKDLFRNLYASKEKGKFSVERIVTYLVDRGKRKWIFNPAVRNWFEDNRHRHYGGSHVQDLEFTERYILYRIENWKREKNEENLLNFAEGEFPSIRQRVLSYHNLQDEYAVASFGNLTFCWGIESRPSNADFDQMQNFLREHNNDKLILNREICQAGNWWTDNINKRTEDLLSIFHAIWKSAEDFLSSTNSWEGLEEMYKVGSKIKGKVVDVSSRWGMILELEQNVKGRIPKDELTWVTGNIDPAEYVKEGDIIEAEIIEISEEKQLFLLSRKKLLPDPWAEVPKKYKVGTVVKGKIYNIKGFGAFVKLEEGITGLIHISELAGRNVESPEEVVSVGDELDLKVIRLDMEERKIGLSLRAVMRDAWVKAPETYKVGTVVQGKIVRLTDVGALAELERGITGLIPNSKLAYKQFERPEEIVSVGEVLDLKVVRVRPEVRKIELSLRAVMHDPWIKAPETYKVGTVVRRKIAHLTDFGAFVDLEEEIRGFIPNSQLSDRRIDNPAEIVSVGEELDLKVIKVDLEKRQIALSLVQVKLERYRKGSVVRGRIVSLTDFGAFVDLEEGISGLIYNSELTDRRIDNPAEIVSVGEELDLKVIKVDLEKRQIALSLKAIVKESRRKPLPRNRGNKKKPLPRNRRGKKQPNNLMSTRYKEAMRTKNTNKSKG